MKALAKCRGKRGRIARAFRLGGWGWVLFLICGAPAAAPRQARQPSRPVVVSPRLAAGIAEFRQFHFRRAAAAFRAVELAHPGKTGALLWLAKCRINLGQLAMAQNDLETFLARKPRSDDALSLLGFVDFRRHHPHRSLAAYARAASIQPPLGDDYKIMGLDYIALRDWKHARRELARAVRLEPQNLQAQYYLAWMQYIANQFTPASRRLQRLARAEPRNLNVLTLLGLTLEAQSHFRRAAAIFLKAIALEPGLQARNAQPYIGYGILLERTGHPRQAGRQLRAALRIKPASFRALAHLGHIDLMLNRLPPAERELTAALRLNPRYRPAYYQLAQVYRREGKITQERLALQELAKLPLHNVPQ